MRTSPYSITVVTKIHIRGMQESQSHTGARGCSTAVSVDRRVRVTQELKVLHCWLFRQLERQGYRGSRGYSHCWIWREMKRIKSQGNRAPYWIRKVKPIGYSCTLQQKPIYSEIFIWEFLISKTVRHCIPTGVLSAWCNCTSVYSPTQTWRQRKKLAILFYHSPSSFETRNKNRASN